MREAEDVVDEEQHVLALVAEMLGDGKARKRHAHACARRLVHLAKHHARLLDHAAAGVADLRFLHFQPQIGPFALAEVCEVMKLASSEGWTVLPAGAMTWPDAGRTSPSPHIIVSTQRLNRLIEHEPADLIAITEAGVTLKDFNDALMQKGQWLPLDPPDDGHATIGGVVATGLGGAQQFGYGPPRKHVIGMKVVLADGSLIKVGGRVVKNVAGYDLCKLFTGSYGTLGVIVELNFKLRPLPFKTSTTIVSGKREDLLAGARRVIDSRLFPVALELLSPRFAYEAEWTEGSDHLLLIRFAGSLSGIAEQTISTGALFKKNHCGKPGPPVPDDTMIWNTLAALLSRLQGDLVWRVGLQPADVPTFLAKLDQENESKGSSELMWQASIGDGRIRVVNRLRPGGESGDDRIRRLELFQSLAKSLGSRLIIEHASVEIKDHLANTRGTFADGYGIMLRIKQHLDPDGIFPSLSAY